MLIIMCFFHGESKLRSRSGFFCCRFIFFVHLIRIKVIIQNKNNCLIPVKPNSVFSWGTATLYGALFHLTLNDVNFSQFVYTLNIHMNKYYQNERKNNLFSNIQLFHFVMKGSRVLQYINFKQRLMCTN